MASEAIRSASDPGTPRTCRIQPAVPNPQTDPSEQCGKYQGTDDREQANKGQIDGCLVPEQYVAPGDGQQRKHEGEVTDHAGHEDTRQPGSNQAERIGGLVVTGVHCLADRESICEVVVSRAVRYNGECQQNADGDQHEAQDFAFAVPGYSGRFAGFPFTHERWWEPVIITLQSTAGLV